MEDVFDVKLDHRAAALLQKLKTIVIIGLGLSVLISICDVSIAYIRFHGYMKLVRTSPPMIRLQSYVSFISLFVMPALALVQGILFYRFISKANDALEYSNSIEFNRAFRWLYWNVVVSLGSFFISTVMSILMLYTEYQIARTYLS
jgi:hypothetical protein